MGHIGMVGLQQVSPRHANRTQRQSDETASPRRRRWPQRSGGSSPTAGQLGPARGGVGLGPARQSGVRPTTCVRPQLRVIPQRRVDQQNRGRLAVAPPTISGLSMCAQPRHQSEMSHLSPFSLSALARPQPDPRTCSAAQMLQRSRLTAQWLPALQMGAHRTSRAPRRRCWWPLSWRQGSPPLRRCTRSSLHVAAKGSRAGHSITFKGRVCNAVAGAGPVLGWSHVARSLHQVW